MVRSRPSIVTTPESGSRKAAASPAIVVLPDPEVPTSAVMVPAAACRLTSCSTAWSSRYPKETRSKAMSPRSRGSATVRPGSWPSGRFASTSSVRSRPASVSVSSVPMRLICTIGAIMKPRYRLNDTKSPIVMAPRRIRAAPTPMISTAESPMISPPPLVSRLVAVSDVRTFSKMRSTPREKTRSSCGSAWKPLITRMPLNDSVSRPVTSALMAPRSRKIGRIARNALADTTPNTASGTSVNSVI